MATCLFLWGALLYCLSPAAAADTADFGKWWSTEGQRLYAVYAPPRHCHYETNIACADGARMR